MDRKLAKFLLNYYISMFDLLKRYNYHPKDVNNMYCPFHHNIHTPAAKMYRDQYGWVLWCFNEKRIFTTWDVYEQLLNIDPMVIANKLWSKLTVEQQQSIMNIAGNQVDFEGDVPYLEELKAFSTRKITYQQLCNSIALKL